MSTEGKTITVVLCIGLIIGLVGGAFLFKRVLDVSDTNSRFICSFGAAITQEPVKQKHAETDQEFRTRVALTEEFLNDLAQDLRDRHLPTKLTIDEASRGVLRKGVDAGNGKSPSGQPGPGEGPTPAEPSPGGPPPSEPKILGPVCDAASELGVPLC